MVHSYTFTNERRWQNHIHNLGPNQRQGQNTAAGDALCSNIYSHAIRIFIGTESFPGVKSGRGVTLTPHPLLMPWSRKGRTIPLLPLWAVRPVQSLSACTRAHFTFTLQYSYTSTPPMGRTACTEPQCLYKGALYLLTFIRIFTREI